MVTVLWPLWLIEPRRLVATMVPVAVVIATTTLQLVRPQPLGLLQRLWIVLRQTPSGTDIALRIAVYLSVEAS